MSNWTHVAAIFRVDGFSGPCSENFDFDKIFGKECVLNSTEDSEWEKFCNELRKVSENSEDYLPMGSEGSLQKSVWLNPDDGTLARFVISVWGDLRDHDSIEEIENWFRKCCEKLPIRQAVCEISNERYGNKVISY